MLIPHIVPSFITPHVIGSAILSHRAAMNIGDYEIDDNHDSGDERSDGRDETTSQKAPTRDTSEMGLDSGLILSI